MPQYKDYLELHRLEYIEPNRNAAGFATRPSWDQLAALVAVRGADGVPGIEECRDCMGRNFVDVNSCWNQWQKLGDNDFFELLSSVPNQVENWGTSGIWGGSCTCPKYAPLTRS